MAWGSALHPTVILSLTGDPEWIESDIAEVMYFQKLGDFEISSK